MPFRPLKSFFPAADELLRQDLPTLGRVLLEHLKSYQGLNTVYQHGGLNRGYFRAMLDNRNVGLGPLPKEPEYGPRQPEVTTRMMEAWNWLERQGYLIRNDQQVGDWFLISSDGEKYLAQTSSPAPSFSGPVKLDASNGAPLAFLSYSWDDDEHRTWVAELAKRLQGQSGVEIIFDQWHLHPGEDRFRFMEQAVVKSDFVIVVCTPKYAERANERKGGVGYEATVITAELAERLETNKFIPVLRSGNWSSSIPVYLKSRMGVDLSGEPYSTVEYQRLLRVLHGEPIQPPPLGSKPDFSRESLPSQAAVASAAVKDRRARFRSPGEPLGMFWDSLPLLERPEYDVFLKDGPAMWLRVMPHSPASKEWTHDELRKCARKPTIPLQPLLWEKLLYLRAEDGFGVYETSDPTKPEPQTRSVAFAFTNGEIWSVDTIVLQMSGRQNLYFRDIVKPLIERLPDFSEFLECLGMEPPFNWIAGLEDIKGWRLKVEPPPNHVNTSPGETSLSNFVVASGTYSPGQTVAVALRPFFDQLFRRCGTSIPPHIEEAIQSGQQY